MEISVNEYLVIPNYALFEYYDSLISRFFKILPIFEGKDVFTKEKIYSNDVAIENYKKYIENFIVEIYGTTKIIDNILLIRLLTILVGMEALNENEHRKVKACVFNCIDICKKLKEGV